MQAGITKGRATAAARKEARFKAGAVKRRAQRPAPLQVPVGDLSEWGCSKQGGVIHDRQCVECSAAYMLQCPGYFCWHHCDLPCCPVHHVAAPSRAVLSQPPVCLQLEPQADTRVAPCEPTALTAHQQLLCPGLLLHHAAPLPHGHFCAVLRE